MNDYQRPAGTDCTSGSMLGGILESVAARLPCGVWCVTSCGVWSSAFDSRTWAKSDWYWLTGARCIVAEALGSEEVVRETDHERVAGLFCLAMAARLDADDSLGTEPCRSESPSRGGRTGVSTSSPAKYPPPWSQTYGRS